MTQEQKNFIERVGKSAAADMKKNGILASLTIAQAILESGWGKSGLTVKANALFGIKATSSWTGKVYNSKTLECYDGKTLVAVDGCFRAYDSWDESIADHSALLTGASRYAAVIGEKDYKQACRAIKAAGYATDPAYAEKLISLIEQYGLTAYDRANSGTSPAPTQPASPSIPAANYKTGDIVLFTSGAVYVSSIAAIPAYSCGKSQCKITQTARGAKNPYHLISEDSGGVYGWVAAMDVAAIGTSPAPIAPAAPLVAVKKGDIVNFIGGAVYTSSNAGTAAATKGASRCECTQTYNGKHPYHLVSKDGRGVYGWVDAERIALAARGEV